MWRSAGKAGTVFFASFRRPPELGTTPLKRAGPPKMRQNSKILKCVSFKVRPSQLYGQLPKMRNP